MDFRVLGLGIYVYEKSFLLIELFVIYIVFIIKMKLMLVFLFIL